MGINEIIALGVVAVRECRKRNNDSAAREAVRAYRSARHDYPAFKCPELRDADRAVKLAEGRLYRFM